MERTCFPSGSSGDTLLFRNRERHGAELYRSVCALFHRATAWVAFIVVFTTLCGFIGALSAATRGQALQEGRCAVSGRGGNGCGRSADAMRRRFAKTIGIGRLFAKPVSHGYLLGGVFCLRACWIFGPALAVFACLSCLSAKMAACAWRRAFVAVLGACFGSRIRFAGLRMVVFSEFLRAYVLESLAGVSRDVGSGDDASGELSSFLHASTRRPPSLGYLWYSVSFRPCARRFVLWWNRCATAA